MANIQLIKGIALPILSIVVLLGVIIFGNFGKEITIGGIATATTSNPRQVTLATQDPTSQLPLVDTSQPQTATQPALTLQPTTDVQENSQASVKLYRVFEIALRADNPSNSPYKDGPSVEATFTGVSGDASGKSILIKGFWDGDNSWKLRFSPTAQGKWIYETRSSDPGLNGVQGSLSAEKPTQSDFDENQLYHGFLEREGFHWKLSDGTLFLPVGDTQWSFAEEFTDREWEEWMRARQTQGFNTFLGSVWLAKYDRPEATSPPFVDKDPKNETLQVSYFQRLDRMIQYANDHGIIVGLAIGGFPEDSQWFRRFGTRERNDRWFKYVVARYSAYNVRWVLYGEANEANPPWGANWEQEVAHNAKLVKDEDPYNHPLGSHHNYYDHSSASNPNIDYIEVQVDRTEDQYKNALDLRGYGKPVWFEEYWYEPQEYDNEYKLGIRNTYRNFVAAMAFPTMGSLMRAHYPNFKINEVYMDPGAVRMCYFVKFYNGLELDRFSPAPDLVDRGQSSRFGDTIAIFLQGGGRVRVDLTKDQGNYSVEVLDINLGKERDMGKISAGKMQTIDTASSSDVSILLTKEGSAMKVRPLLVDSELRYKVLIPVVQRGFATLSQESCRVP